MQNPAVTHSDLIVSFKDKDASKALGTKKHSEQHIVGSDGASPRIVNGFRHQ